MHVVQCRLGNVDFCAGKRNRDLQSKIEQTAEEQQLARQQFEQLTEAASSLMDSGELNIYSQKKVLHLLPATANTAQQRQWYTC